MSKGWLGCRCDGARVSTHSAIVGHNFGAGILHHPQGDCSLSTLWCGSIDYSLRLPPGYLSLPGPSSTLYPFPRRPRRHIRPFLLTRRSCWSPDGAICPVPDQFSTYSVRLLLSQDGRHSCGNNHPNVDFRRRVFRLAFTNR